MTVSFFLFFCSNKWQIKRRNKKEKKSEETWCKDLREQRRELITGAEEEAQHYFATFMSRSRETVTLKRNMRRDIFNVPALT